MPDPRSLSNEERHLIRRCLDAAVNGPFFPDWEFYALFGLKREEVRTVLETWPETSDAETQRVAVNNALNNLLGYPHRKEEALAQLTGATRAEIAAVLAKWRGEQQFDSSGRGFFDRLE